MATIKQRGDSYKIPFRSYDLNGKRYAAMTWKTRGRHDGIGRSRKSLTGRPCCSRRCRNGQVPMAT